MNLPLETAKYLDKDRLAYNVDSYDIPLIALNLGEQAAVALIRKNLLAIPLTHATKASANSLLEKGIIPSGHPDNPRFKNNSNILDRSLGLDKFTFMHWGAVGENNYGSTIALLDTKTIIESPQTIATPEDITAHIFLGRRTPYEKLKPHRQRKVQEYFDGAVTGKDWVDIMAIRALYSMQNRPRPAYQLQMQDDLGEVKHAGILTPDMITGVITNKATSLEAQCAMLRRGFSPVSKQSLPATESIATWNEILEEANRSQN